MAEQTRRRYVFRGVIQGVGFRPAVYRCAVALGLSGFVQNRSSEVVVEVQGEPRAVGSLLERLRSELPPAARIEEASEQDLPLSAGENGFRIAGSESSAFTFPPIPCDLAICEDCRRELLDPRDRRYLYPFITCTQCGPRYTIVANTPFDRETTSMAEFPLCPDCRAEYENPQDRRFHAETISCPRCGPHLALWDTAGKPVAGEPVLAAVEALARGLVVAIQGLGGFHLAADPLHPEAVARLRRAKDRARRPFAIMVRDLEAARELCMLEEADRRELASARAPILILRARDERLRAVSDTGTLGLMLPYTPLHLLLFVHPSARIPYRALVMTSANAREEPMLTDPEEARERLTGVADLLLCHDRRILHRADDSVLLPVLHGPGRAPEARRSAPVRGTCLVRRSRGYVPELLRLAVDLGRTVLAVGGDLKNAPALGVGRDLHLAAHVGDLENPRAVREFETQVRALLELYRAEPDEILYDPHPLYHSRRWALEFAAPRHTAVQHHHAHLLSVMAEHGLEECIGLAFDGTGYGEDGTVWGGECLHATRSGFRRLGHLATFPLPGGEAAIRRPIRIAFAILQEPFAASAGHCEASEPKEAPESSGEPELPELEPGERALLARMLQTGTHCPRTSSVGRLFDAAAALLGLVDRVSYEGEGPMLLEARARAAAPCGPHPATEGLVRLECGEPFRIDARPLLRELARRRSSEDVGALALLFHRSIAEAAVLAAEAMRRSTGLAALALSGGVFQNALLRELLIPSLLEAGFEVYTNLRVPPGDGGLAVGQAYFVPRAASP